MTYKKILLAILALNLSSLSYADILENKPETGLKAKVTVEQIEKAQKKALKEQQENSKDPKKAQDNTIEIKKTYSYTIVHLAPECSFSVAKAFCNTIAQGLARSFERERIIKVNEQINYENPDFSFFDKIAKQTVHLNFILNKNAEVITLYAVIRKDFPDNTKSVNVQTFSYKLENSKKLVFNELFEYPDIASEIIGQLLYNRYKKANSKYLPIVVSSIKIKPKNYIITTKGLRFYFAPQTVNTDTSRFEYFDVRIEELQKANPVKKWWPYFYKQKNEETKK